MADIKVTATGGVRGSTLPAGTLPPVADPLTGTIVVQITSTCKSHPTYDLDGNVVVNSSELQAEIDTSPRVYAMCLYPDGFEREHHTTDPVDLLQKIVNQLRGRYGSSDVKCTEAPSEVKAGAIYKLEV